MHSHLASIIGLFSVAGLISGATCDSTAPTATVDNGVLVGKATSLPAGLAPVNQFLGVPFAVSPPERFAPPQAASANTNTINTTAWKPACLQQFQCMPESINLLSRN